MDRGPTTPRGVSIRNFKHGDRIQIAFSYRGTECKELMPPGNITKTAITHAQGMRLEILRRIKDGSFNYADYFPDSPRAQASTKRTLIGNLLDDQLEIYSRQAEAGQLSPSTLDGYAKAINSERMSVWRKKTLQEATPSALRSWISDMGVTAKFARNLLIPLRSVFEDALNDDLIEFNPFERIALTKLLKQTSRSSEYEVDPFTQEERDKLIEAARPDERPMVQFWFETGLRPGELQALRWAKIDTKKATARIDANQVVGIEKGPKTEAGIRTVDLSAEALKALEAQRLISGAKNDHVWTNPRTNKAWTTDAQIRKTLWIPLVERSGVRYRNPYQARHTFASSQLTAGANPWYIASQLGHVDVQMVFRIYGKFIAQDFQRPVPKLRVVGD
jgi:integrase